MKKTLNIRSIICLVLVLILCFAQSGAVFANTDWKAISLSDVQPASASSEEEVQNEGVVRPEDLDEGLSRKSLDEIEGRRVTVRQPIMEVTNREVDRTPATELGNTFTFIDPDTGKPYDGDGKEYAQIDFSSQEQNGNPSAELYPKQGLSRGERLYFSDFTKYMLLRQAWYYNQNAQQLISENKMFKHPAVDGIYGEISPTAKAVTKHIVTDPIYRSPMTTGLYLAPGEKATVTVKGLKKGETLTLYTHHQDTLAYAGGTGSDVAIPADKKGVDGYFYYWDKVLLNELQSALNEKRDPDYTKFDFSLQGQWKWQNQKVPCMGATFVIEGTGGDVTCDIGCIYGGPLYVQPTDSALDITVTGAVETPHFVLGVTTVEEFDEYLRTAPGLIATLDVENGQLIGPAQYMRDCDDINKLGYFWHSVFAINSSLNGRAYNYNISMKYDMHVPAGSAVALDAHTCAQPSEWFKTCMSYETLTTAGNWGTFHELGHVQAKTYNTNWGFGDGEGEVWNNTLIVLMYSMICNMDNRFVTVEHGEFVHPYTAISRSLNITQTYGDGVQITDYSQINNGNGAHFDQLTMYASLIHSFGPDKFVDMFYTYKLNAKYCQNKRADFVYRIGLIDHVNIFNWVNDNYFANIKKSDFTASQWDYLDNLPDFYPIAYRWANGTDGIETARKYEVDGKNETVFDLSGENIVCPVDLEILSVSNAVYGTTKYDDETKKVTYTPPKNVTEYDRFDIVVRTEGGRRTVLNVNFKLIYRGTYTEVWDLGSRADWSNNTSPSIQTALTFIGDKAPTSIEESTVAGKATFNHQNLEYFRMRFKFRADVDGEHWFYLRSDDCAQVDFLKDNENGESLGTLSTSTYTNNFSESNKLNINLKKGEMVYIKVQLVNWGGQGFAYVGVKFPETESIVNIPSKNIVNALATEEDLVIADKFVGWQPQFLDSIKDATMEYKADKEGWKVLSAPADNGSTTKDNIVDGKEDTLYHNKWQGSDVPKYPHEIVIDTQMAQLYNYFDLVLRQNSVNLVKSCKLEGSTDGENYDVLYSNDNITASYRLRFSFDDVTVRYFKLTINQTSQNQVTCIAEVYAGYQTELNQTVKPSNYQKDAEGFEENKANGKLSADAQNAFYEFAFLGTGFDVYADTAENYGSAKVYVDGNDKGDITLGGKAIFNKCVYKCADLPIAEHTVRIEVQEAPFNISFINVSFETPVEERDYPALKDADGNDDYGDTSIARAFSAQWRTVVTDYKELTEIHFVKQAPEGYTDTLRRMDTYIRIYRDGADNSKLAFVYPGVIEAPVECGSLFAGCSDLSVIELENLDTSEVRGAVSMFNGCAELQSIDLSGFKSDNIQWMATMFAHCTKLQNIDLSTVSVTDDANISRMFDGCTALQTITLSSSFGEDVTGELPGVYKDTQTNVYSHTLSSANAGHVLQLHATHTQGTTHAQVDPTCTQTGKLAYWDCAECHFSCIDGKYVEERDLIIPANGHSGELKDGKAPTCTEAGYNSYVQCTVCGEILSGHEEVEAFGHIYTETLEGKAPTCKEKGLTEGERCLVCGEIVVEQKEIPMSDHVWGDWETVTEATASTNGLRRRTCTEGHVEEEIIFATGSGSGTEKGPNTVAVLLGSLGGALVLCAIAVAIIVLVKKRRS